MKNKLVILHDTFCYFPFKLDTKSSLTDHLLSLKAKPQLNKPVNNNFFKIICSQLDLKSVYLNSSYFSQPIASIS